MAWWFRCAAEYVAKVDEMVQESERAVLQEDIDNQVELLANWKLQSDRTTTREWDLNDPRQLSKDRPLREGDDDPRCGPASMLKFDGEDLHKAEREAALLEDVRVCVCVCVL